MTSNEISLIKQALLIVELREVRLMDSFPTIDADHSQEYLEKDLLIQDTTPKDFLKN